MSRTRVVLILIILLVIGLAVWVRQMKTAPPEVPFAPVERERLVSSLSTNGQVEPEAWVSVRAQRAGVVARVAVEKGQDVGRGALLVELAAEDARAEVTAAEAAVAQASARLQTLTQGGSAASRVEIANEIARDRQDLAAAQSDYDALKRLEEKQAATGQQVTDAARRVERLRTAIEGLEKRQAALVDTTDLASARARLEEAQATLEQARVRLQHSFIRSPLTGTVYDLPVRRGSYVNAGDPVASVGNLRTLRVRIFVDEPELGRVAVGMPVTVTWDALQGREWRGTVEKMPTEIVALGTRHVGVVHSTIQNPDLKLVPGTNVAVEITSQVVAAGFTIPKEAIRTENAQTGVYVLRDDHVEWRPIKLGASSITRAVVTSGLAPGDQVALRSQRALHNGESVRVAAR
jgi:HlyD family secretion protein